MALPATAKARWLQEDQHSAVSDFDKLRAALCRAVNDPEETLHLAKAIRFLWVLHFRPEPMRRVWRDDLLTVTARAHCKALDALSRWLTPDQIDQGMQALAARIILLSETDEQKASRPADALRDIDYRTLLFHNQLENIGLAEALTLDVIEEKRAEEMARILGRANREGREQ